MIFFGVPLSGLKNRSFKKELCRNSFSPKERCLYSFMLRELFIHFSSIFPFLGDKRPWLHLKNLQKKDWVINQIENLRLT